MNDIFLGDFCGQEDLNKEYKIFTLGYDVANMLKYGIFNNKRKINKISQDTIDAYVNKRKEFLAKKTKAGKKASKKASKKTLKKASKKAVKKASKKSSKKVSKKKVKKTSKKPNKK